MSVNWRDDLPWLPVAGVRLASAAAGIRYRGRDDLVLMAFDPDTTVAGVFTRNAFCAAPVHLARRHLRTEGVRAFLINAGNANAGTGHSGMQVAEQSCQLAADHLGCRPEQILPFSTGVIGEQMPIKPFDRSLPQLVKQLEESQWGRASRAIMTTDTQPKLRSRQFRLADGRECVLTGMSKGAGMIKPDMATMLAFIATDAPVAKADLQSFLASAVNVSFNAITVDGDTSTNDACVIAATGMAGGDPICPQSSQGDIFAAELTALLQELAKGIVRDAEGATRFIEVCVEGATDLAEARKVAYTVAESPLVKTAAFAGDPNWGRILAAVGRSGIAALDVDSVSLWLDKVCLVQNGQPHPEYTEASGATVAGQAEFQIRISLGRGDISTRVWTCDYSYDYVKINAEYRS